MELSNLTTEARNPASEEIDRLTSIEIVRLMNAEDSKVAAAIGRVAEHVASAIDVVADRLRRGGRLVYIGAGTSGRLGVLDASECPPTFNTKPWQVVGLIAGGLEALTRSIEGAEDIPESAVQDLKSIDLSAQDVVLGIATSGRTPYVVAGLAYAGQIGAFAIGLSCNEDSELSKVSQVTIAPVVGPEVVSGSTRLKAGTATKMILNTITTGAMVRLGKTYGNLMVDLQTTNQKLTERSKRIVTTLAGVSPPEAERLLERCGGDAKTATVAHLRSVGPEEARRLLTESNGQLRSAIEPAGQPIADRPADPSHTPHQTAEGLVLGVDGGGSKTVAYLVPIGATETKPVGVGKAGPSNPNSTGWQRAMENLEYAIDRAFQAADIPRRAVASACLALAGAGRESAQQRIREWARRRNVADQIIVTHDGEPILAAGTPDCVGIAIVAGTGSFACGRNADGNWARSGGWGHLMGDEGSAYNVARNGLRAAARALDGRGHKTSLAESLFDAIGVKDRSGMVNAVYSRQSDRQWLASLAKVVVAMAVAGDHVALAIIDEAAKELAQLCRSVTDQLTGDRFTNRFPIVLAGGLLVHAPLLRDRVLEEIRRMGLGGTCAKVVKEPVLGAVKLADWDRRENREQGSGEKPLRNKKAGGNIPRKQQGKH